MFAVNVHARVGDLDLRVDLPPADGTTVLIGPNGAGKSTLLKCILGIVRPLQGRVALQGKSLFCSTSRTNLPTETRRLGYVPQNYALFAHLSVLANVGFGIEAPRRKDRRARAMELLQDLGLAELARRKPEALSGGEAQRVALARALAISPRALLLDEPMAALDAGVRRKVREFLAVRIRAIGIPTLIVSHDIDDVDALGGRVVVVEHGRVAQVGTAEELRARPATEFVAEFVRRGEPVAGLASVHELRSVSSAARSS